MAVHPLPESCPHLKAAFCRQCLLELLHGLSARHVAELAAIRQKQKDLARRLVEAVAPIGKLVIPE
jgi:hypothetical protein